MEISQYTCKKCDYSVDHPIDTCPVCGAIFYWLIRSKEPLDEQLRKSYFEQMSELVQGNLDTNYIFHGGKIWLPHGFWQYHPTGESLAEFNWIKDLKLVQYKKNTGQKITQAKPVGNEPTSFETNPRIQVLDKAIKSQGLATPARVVISSRIKPEINESSSWLSQMKPFQGSISVGLFLIFIALAYFFMCLGAQNNLKNNQENLTNSFPQTTVNEDLKQ